MRTYQKKNRLLPKWNMVAFFSWVLIFGTLASCEADKVTDEGNPADGGPFGTNLTFQFSVSEVSDVSAVIEVKPSSDTELYYTTVVTESDFTTEQELMEQVVEKFRQQAASDQVSLADVIFSQCKYGTFKKEYEELDVLSDYMVVAFQITESGETGNFASESFATLTDMDKFGFEFNVENLGPWVCDNIVTPTDLYKTYIADFYSADELDKWKDEEFMEYYIKEYEQYLPLMMRKGQIELTNDMLFPGQRTYAFAFGYDNKTKKITTKLHKYEIKVPTVDFVSNFKASVRASKITSVSATVVFMPSADNLESLRLKYMYGITPKEQLSGATLKNVIQGQINQNIKDMKGRFPGYKQEEIVNALLAKGTKNMEYFNLKPAAEYTAWAVLTDAQGTIYGEVSHSDFRTLDYVLSDAEIDGDVTAYYDGDEVLKLEPNALYVGNAIIRVELSKVSDGAEAYFCVVTGDYSDEQIMADVDLISVIVQSSPNKPVVGKQYHAFSSWDKKEEIDKTLLMVVKDKQGNFSKVVRKLYHLTREGANPPEEYVNR